MESRRKRRGLQAAAVSSPHDVVCGLFTSISGRASESQRIPGYVCKLRSPSDSRRRRHGDTDVMTSTCTDLMGTFLCVCVDI